MVRNFAGYAFDRVGAIRPDRDGRGVLVQHRPRPGNNSQLHKYGSGPFCRFRIAQESSWQRSGVYVVMCSDAVRYVGECKNLAKIWNSVGGITSSAVREGGRQTHCRINNLILNEAKRGVETVLWFHAVSDDALRRACKNKVATARNPTWNLTSPSSPPSSPPRTRAASQEKARPFAESEARPVLSQRRVTTQRRIAGLFFSYVGPIRPQRDRSGGVIEDKPQSRFVNERNLRLHKYGHGPFCRFHVAEGWKWNGVYILMTENSPLYVGECENLERRWGSMGYGTISPRACFTGGQETNCRINNLIYRGTKIGAGFDLWFHPIVGGKQARLTVESRLVAALRPPWNKQAI